MLDAESPEGLAWAELQRRGSIRERYLRGIESEIATELARCLDPVVHELDIRPYGAIVARETPHLERLGRVLDTTGLSDEVVRSLADGIHSVVLVVKGEAPRLLLLHESMDTDQDYASHAVWVDGLIICNDGRGIVRLVTDSSVTMVEGRRWMAKDLVYEAAEDIVHVVPAANLDVVRRLLELAHHHISQKRFGASLLYALTDTPDAPTTAGRGDRGCRTGAVDPERVRRAAAAAPGALSRRRAAVRPRRPAARRQRDHAADPQQRAGRAGDQGHAPYVGGAAHLRLSRTSSPSSSRPTVR